MVNMAARMRRLNERLLDIRVGSGAMVLPKTIKRIHLRIPNNANTGSRKFTINELRRLKYHNPAVSMTVDKFTRTGTPGKEESILSIHYAPSDAQQTSKSATSSAGPTDVSTSGSSKPSSQAPTEKVDTIDVTNKSRLVILEEFMRITNATPIEPTEEDKELMSSLEEQRAQSAADAKLMAEVKAKHQREKALLEAARGDIAANAAEA